MLQKQKFDQEEKLGNLEREVQTFKQKEKGISWNELKDNIFHFLYSADSAEVGVASVVQEDVRYHTTDGELSDNMLPHNYGLVISRLNPDSQYVLRHKHQADAGIDLVFISVLCRQC